MPIYLMTSFATCQMSGIERKRVKTKKRMEKLSRIGIYAAAIASFAIGHENTMAFATAASAICLAFECLRG